MTYTEMVYQLHEQPGLLFMVATAAFLLTAWALLTLRREGR